MGSIIGQKIDYNGVGGSERPVAHTSGEERCATTLITAAKETRHSPTCKIVKVIKLSKNIASKDSGIIFMIIIIFFYNYYYYYYYYYYACSFSYSGLVVCDL